MSKKSNNVRGDSEFPRRFVEALKSQKLLNRIGLTATRRMKERIRKGVDKNEKPFKQGIKTRDGEAYSPSWATKRIQQERQVQFIDLQFSNYEPMIDFLDFVVTDDFSSVQLFFSRADKAQVAKWTAIEGVGRNRLIRDFWGFPRKDEEEFKQILEQNIQSLLREL